MINKLIADRQTLDSLEKKLIRLSEAYNWAIKHDEKKYIRSLKKQIDKLEKNISKIKIDVILEEQENE